ncbi:MAG: hypothetical protein ACM3TR_10130 [Caulobacteraceae bacterium]
MLYFPASQGFRSGALNHIELATSSLPGCVLPVALKMERVKEMKKPSNFTLAGSDIAGKSKADHVESVIWRFCLI